MGCKILLSTTVSWTSTARHAAGFALAGAEVVALAPRHAPVTASRYVSASYVHRPILGLASLRQAIDRAAPDLIVPCDDRAVENLLGVHAREPAKSPVSALIERSLGRPERYGQVISRTGSLAIARGLGIRTPETYPVANEEALERCLDILGLPAVLKVDGSWGGEGVVVAKTREEARAAFHKLASPPSRVRSLGRAVRRRDSHHLLTALSPRAGRVSIQRFVHGRPAASAFACWQGEVKAAIYYDVLVADGAIGPPSVIRRIDNPEMAEATQRLARHFGLSGLHGLDFIREENGVAHLIEINPRATQGGTLPFGPGRDLAAALCGCVMPGAVSRDPIASNTVVFFPRQWLRDPSSALLRDGHHDVPWDDPAILRASLQRLPPIAKFAGRKQIAASIPVAAGPLNAPLPEPAAGS
jgi:hypothetical protein